MKSGTHWVPTQVKQWKKQLQEEGAELFNEKASNVEREQAEKETGLYEQIGRLQVELAWLKKKLPESAAAKRAMIEPEHPELSIRRQCEVLNLNRATYYYQPATETELRNED